MTRTRRSRGGASGAVNARRGASGQLRAAAQPRLVAILRKRCRNS